MEQNKAKLQYFLLISVLVIAVSADQLVMIEEIFRHGARYPLWAQEIDNSIIAQKQNSLGELTLQGKNMHYFLGKILYQKYWKALFEGTPYENQYNQSQFYVKSTDVNRTIESVQSQLFGMLQKLPKLELQEKDYPYSLPAWGDLSGLPEEQNGTWAIFKTGQNFHPTPVHVQKLGANQCDEGDFLRKYDNSSCPNQQFWKEQNMNSQASKKVQKDQRVIEALKALSLVVQHNVTFFEAQRWKDSQICLQYLSETYLPIFDDPKHGPIYDFIYVYGLYLLTYSQHQQIRAVGTNIINQTLNNILGKINGNYSPRVVLYSAHDTTVGMMLAILNMTNVDCIIDHYLNGVNNDETCIWAYPKFSSNIIFQLWKNSESKYYIRILYEGVPKNIPICDNLVECPVDKFIQWANQFMVNDVTSACGIQTGYKSYFALTFILVVIIIILLLGLCYTRYKKNIESVVTHKQYEDQIDEKQTEGQKQYQLK